MEEKGLLLEARDPSSTRAHCGFYASTACGPSRPGRLLVPALTTIAARAQALALERALPSTCGVPSTWRAKRVSGQRRPSVAMVSLSYWIWLPCDWTVCLLSWDSRLSLLSSPYSCPCRCRCRCRARGCSPTTRSSRRTPS